MHKLTSFANVSSNISCRRYFWDVVKLHLNMSTGIEKINNNNVVAITQMCSTNDKLANILQVETLVKRAKEQAAKFVFLPECCDFVGENRDQTLELSEPLIGKTMEKYQALAKKYKMWLSLGGIHELILDQCGNKTDKIYNTHVVLNDCGELVEVYRKLHLFDVETPDFKFQESKVVSAGNHFVPPINTPFGRIGLLICYDLRFPECSLLLRKREAQVLTYPSAFAYSTGQNHWEPLLRARAIENQCFVLASAQVGWHNKKRQSWGHAMAIGPWGQILADLDTQELDVATIDLNLSVIEPIRNQMPCFQHRRDDIYSLNSKNLRYTVEEDFCFADCIIKKETIFIETPYCYAFTNLRCVVEGHVLVCTHRCVPRLKDLTISEQNDLFTTVCIVQQMLETFYQTESATVTVQDGIYAGQTVPHVHFHVMPRRPDDFKHNDQIYEKIENKSNDICKKDRTLDERISEAEKYRKFLTTQQY